ncbi:MAG: bacteriophage holin [Acidobacteria bacterium]|nr:bacteriophage holin [Acidobacteriota bacterium]
MKLNIKALALTIGLVWGVGIFLFTWWVIIFEGSTAEPTIIAKLYRGYDISPFGSLIGLIWGFLDGLIGGALIGWIYNFLAAKTEK